MSDKNPEKKDEKQGFLDLLHCSDQNFFGCLVRKCLDTSITGKLIGMLVVSLFGFTLVIVQNTIALHKIEHRNTEIQRTSIPQYKITQYILRSLNGFKISLLHMINEEQHIGENDKNIIDNLQRLDDMERMILALKRGGTILDVAKVSQKTLDVFTVDPSSDPQTRLLAEDIMEEFLDFNENFRILANGMVASVPEEEQEENLVNVLDNLDEMQDLVTSLAVYINDKHGRTFQETEDIINTSLYMSILIGVIIALILTVGTILYILLIVVPLKDILEKIKYIAKGEGDLAQRIEVKTNDEVGKLAGQLNNLVDNIFSLNSFKAVIEEEETTTEVNHRLANLLVERYDIKELFIYEPVSNKNNLVVAFATDYKNVCSPEILDDSNFCRAKRTGHPISSIQFPDICKQFPHADKKEHHCIPMIANGKVVGVVQFLFDKDQSPRVFEEFEMRVKRAYRYIKEATPVIEAKRFAAALQETTLKDPMTGLYNRRFLETYSNTLVARTIRQNSRIGMLMCDMDFFKEVNDTYGHETGDVVLIKTAEILLQCIRASDMVIRYGGEEFLVLLIDVKSREDIDELAERIRDKMEETVINIPDGALKKTTSIGYSMFPDDTDGFWESIKFADVALYRAKDEGRNRVIGFTSDMWTEEKY